MEERVLLILVSCTRLLKLRYRKEAAAGALRNLAVNADNKVAIAGAGAIPPLVALLSSGTAAGKEEAAAGALWNLALTPDNRVAIAGAGAIPRAECERGGYPRLEAENARLIAEIACLREAVQPRLLMTDVDTLDGELIDHESRTGIMGATARNGGSKKRARPPTEAEQPSRSSLAAHCLRRSRLRRMFSRKSVTTRRPMRKC